MKKRSTTQAQDRDDHFTRLLNLLEIEQEAEKEDTKRELDRWPVQVRESLGKTVTRLTVVGEDAGVGGMPLLVLSRGHLTGDLSPFHAMNQGDLVRLTFQRHGIVCDGTLYEVEDERAVIALNGAPPSVRDGLCQLDLLGSDATYRRMRRAINIVWRAGGERGALRDVILGAWPATVDSPPDVEFFDGSLNSHQRQAVRAAMASRDVSLIHGPPGTGKTTVLVEVIRQAVARGETVLASAPSNIAVDNILEKLLETRLRLVRMGHPARTLGALRHATLTAQEASHPEFKTVHTMDQSRERQLVQWERRQQRGGGVSRSENREVRRETRALWKQARGLEYAIRLELIRGAQVVLVTHGGVGPILYREHFDLVVLDEASQAMEPFSWVPIVQGKRLVMAGDPLQLPPTVHSREAAADGLAVTLMERLQKILPEEAQTHLRLQYRMNDVIMGFSSERFYGGRLEADATVRNHRAADLPGVQPTPLTTAALVFVDTAGTGFQETWNELLDSRENEGEANLALKLWRELEAAGVGPAQTAIITPYRAQVRRLRPLVPRGLEVDTVDGFQGREKEVVIVSLVRSNEEGQVGFLVDTRRMNVAMTRARRLLIVIGDSATITRHRFYTAFVDYADAHDAHRSAWEWNQ